MVSLSRRLGCVAFATGSVAGLALGQDVISTGNCRGVALAGRNIQRLDLSTAFDLLHLAFVRTLTESLRNRVATDIGPRYTDLKVNKAIELLEGQQLSPIPFFGISIAASLVSLSASNCIDRNGVPSVDLDFFLLPARIPTFLGFNKESHAEETTDGARSAGVAPRHLWLTPTAGYSASANLFGGFSAGIDHPFGAIKTLSASGTASTQMRLLNVDASGSYEPDRAWIRHADFTVGFDYRDEPAVEARVQNGHGFLEWKAASDLLPKAGVVVRYGLGAQVGLSRSYGAVPGDGVAPNTRYGSLQGFAGVTRRWTHQSFAVSYALEGERTGGGGVFDFARHFFDASHSVSVAPNHYPIEVESRFSLGQITNLCRKAGCGAPLSERFFAGNIEHNFLSDGSWMIRSAPLLRSFPLNALAGEGGAGRGGESFRAFNLTAAVAVRRKTLVPEDLLREPTFLQRIDRLPDTVTELLAGAYASQDTEFDKDPGIVAARTLLMDIRTELGTLQPQWDALAPSMPTTKMEDYDICTDDALGVLPLDLDDVDGGKKRITLVSNASGALVKTIKCLRSFGKGATDPLTISADHLEKIRSDIELAVSNTDVYARAKQQAVRDMTVAKSTIHTLFHEANLISISPVFTFDAATVGPTPLGLTAWRYGVGGGARFTILSSVRFTAGYAVNVQRRAGEGRGALFASLDILDIFGH